MRLPHFIRRNFDIALVLAAAMLPVSAGHTLANEPTATPATRKIAYSRDIKPILANHCYACHGPDAGQRKADLRLDEREAALESAIAPGDAASSELVSRITSDDPKTRMPPPDSNIKPLSSEQIDHLRQWIDEGANFDTHWSYVSPVSVRPPDSGDPAWADAPIDRFIAVGHVAQGLEPAPEADRVTLIRRLSFDLTGLPPTPREVADFVSDSRPDAYERLVDRLMDSPRFGERLAMYWLDVVRYADTNGIHGDNHQDVAPYREYVIEAFNSNLPFDQFTIEQIAGDLLPSATRSQKIASGYNRLLMTTREGGAQPGEYMAKYSADRVRNASGTWLGSTMGCCECHDHKYDPFTTKDFYSFASFFADIQEVPVGEQPTVKLPPPDDEARLAALDAQLSPLRAVMETATPERAAAQAEWEKQIRDQTVEWITLKPVSATSSDGTTLTIADDGSVLASGEAPMYDTYTLVFKTSAPGITALRLEVLSDPSLPKGGPGRGGSGNFLLTEVNATAAGQNVAWSAVSASFSQPGRDIAGATDTDGATGWAVQGKIGENSHAVFETANDLGDGSELELTAVMKFNFGAGLTIGKFRWSATQFKRPVRAGGENGLPAEVAAAVAVDEPARTDEQRKIVSRYFAGVTPELEAVRRQIADLEAIRKQIDDAILPTLVTVSTPPREIRVLPRGNWLDQSGELVSPTVPGFLGRPLATEGRANRLDLANWLVSPDNPLVARVFVNRLWKLVFGQGIVRSLEDFGTQGELPTHPELLDWLAGDFVASGWNIKRSIKQMVLSRTYRQSSLASRELQLRDPLNLWLARQNRFRLDAEMVRDNALAISGLLVERLGGRSVKPYQPAGYWSHLNFPLREWEADQGVNLYRRGLYTYWCRTFLHPSMLAFDAPSREECTVARARSNTPQQALALLNDPTYVEAARVFAERLLRYGGSTPEERLKFAFQVALSREPRPAEMEILLGLQQKHHAAYSADLESAQKAVSSGNWPVPADRDVVDLASWTSVARTLLNLHETITRY